MDTIIANKGIRLPFGGGVTTMDYFVCGRVGKTPTDAAIYASAHKAWCVTLMDMKGPYLIRGACSAE